MVEKDVIGMFERNCNNEEVPFMECEDICCCDCENVNSCVYVCSDLDNYNRCERLDIPF